MIAYKWLARDGTGPSSRFPWPLPGDGGPGAWVEAAVAPCAGGIHACRIADLPLWVGHALHEAELAVGVVEESTKVVAARGRLLRRVDAWDEAARRDDTRMCAERAHERARSAAPALVDWDAVVEPSVAEGSALLGFVAARIAEEVAGPAGYRAERARQAAWPARRLGLRG